MSYPLWKSAYLVLVWAVICIVTSTVEKFGGFRGNFHNRYGSYIIWGLFFTTVY